jgi:Caspase recruitment domain
MWYLFAETWSSGNREEQPLDKATRKIIKQNWTALTRLLELDCGLVFKLYAAGCLRDSERDIVQEQQTAKQKKEKLLDILLRKSLAAFDAFVRCLEETEQRHILRLLDGTAGNSMLTLYDSCYTLV